MKYREHSSEHYDRLSQRAAQRELFRSGTWAPMPVADVLSRRRPYSFGAGPNIGGVYFIFEGDALTYVGRSWFISERLCQHARQFRRIDSFSYVAVPLTRAVWAELNYIDEARPRDNTPRYRRAC
jgi:hypothetical protein